MKTFDSYSPEFELPAFLSRSCETIEELEHFVDYQEFDEIPFTPEEEEMLPPDVDNNAG